MDLTELPKKKKSKPLFLLLIFLFGFGFFIFLITLPSTISKARDQLNASYNVNDVKLCWDQNKVELGTNKEFVDEVRRKLNSFQLSGSEIKECLSWLPRPPEYLNLILLPDVSNRITTIPGQINHDKEILVSIWESFKSITHLKQNTKDQLLVELSDKNQLNGKFQNIADSLVFDLNTHKNQSNRLYYRKCNDRFNRKINHLYDSAQIDPLGADIHYYFKNKLKSHLKNEDLFSRYRNVLIILTDGYMEPDKGKSETPIDNQILDKALVENNLESTMKNLNLRIPPVNADFSNLTVLVCEVHERKTRMGKDYPILKEYWRNWFQSMIIKNANEDFFLLSEDANNLTISKVKSFLQNK